MGWGGGCGGEGVGEGERGLGWGGGCGGEGVGEGERGWGAERGGEGEGEGEVWEGKGGRILSLSLPSYCILPRVLAPSLPSPLPFPLSLLSPSIPSPPLLPASPLKNRKSVPG